MTPPDLDALEKQFRGAADDFADHATPIEGDGQTATLLRKAADMIAELREARGLLKPFARRAGYWEQINGEGGSDRAETNHAIGDFKKARAFLARNGKGEGQ